MLFKIIKLDYNLTHVTKNIFCKSVAYTLIINCKYLERIFMKIQATFR